MSTEPEQLSEEAAEKLFNDTFNQALGHAPVPDTVVEDKPAVEETAPEVHEDPVKAEAEEAEAKPKEQTDPSSWLESLPEEAKAKYIKDQNDFKANASRNAALQRHLNEARTQLETLKKTTVTPEARPTPVQEKLDKWNALTETDKELALSVEERIQQAVAAVDKKWEERWNRDVVPVQAQQFDNHVERELHLLKQLVPNYEEVARSEDFQNWLPYQPEDVRRKYSESIKHEDALTVMKLYDYDMRTQFGYAPPQQKPPAVTQNPTADKIAAARDARVSTTTQTRQTAVGTPRDPKAELTDAEADKIYDAAFNKFRGHM